MNRKTWNVEIFISEEDNGETHAVAVLSTEESSQMVATGVARRNPHDPEVEEIGDELAAARALTHLGERLMRVVGDDITEATGELVTLGS